LGQVKRGVRDVRFVGDTDNDDNITKWCPSCEEHNFKHKLGPRTLRPGQVKTEDWDYYLECTVCGRLTPKETARVESDISDVVEKDDSNSDGYAISLDDPRLSRRVREYKIIQWD
jgi:hypothetical protein